MRRRAAPVRALLALAVAASLAGCGVPRDDAPRTLDPANAPAGALPSPSRIPEPVGNDRVALYFIREGLVAPVTRPVPQSTSVEPLLELLFAGPTSSEQASGTSSLIPASLLVMNVREQGSTVVVTLGGSEALGRPQVLAFAQIVATLTPDRAAGVRFRLDGADLAVPRSDGSLTDAPVSRLDYAADLLAGDTEPPPAAPLAPPG